MANKTYAWIDSQGIEHKTDSRITAHNEAYYLQVHYYSIRTHKENKVYGIPYQLDTSNLICGGFHNHLIKS